jgi:hypothetical protein
VQRKENLMDPQAAWDQLLAAYAAGDWDILEERATDLIGWLDRGGFPPTILNQTDLDPDWNRALARAGCLHALEIAQSTWSIRA